MLKEASQPIYIEGYHRPDYRSKDDAVFDAISDLMSEGRTSRLYRALVRDKKIASFSEGFTGYPGHQVSASVRISRRAAARTQAAGDGRQPSTPKSIG